MTKGVEKQNEDKISIHSHHGQLSVTISNDHHYLYPTGMRVNDHGISIVQRLWLNHNCVFAPAFGILVSISVHTCGILLILNKSSKC